MQILTASEARANLYRLMDETVASHQAVTLNQPSISTAAEWLAQRYI